MCTCRETGLVSSGGLVRAKEEGEVNSGGNTESLKKHNSLPLLNDQISVKSVCSLPPLCDQAKQLEPLCPVSSQSTVEPLKAGLQQQPLCADKDGSSGILHNHSRSNSSVQHTSSRLSGSHFEHLQVCLPGYELRPSDEDGLSRPCISCGSTDSAREARGSGRWSWLNCFRGDGGGVSAKQQYTWDLAQPAPLLFTNVSNPLSSQAVPVLTGSGVKNRKSYEDGGTELGHVIEGKPPQKGLLSVFSASGGGKGGPLHRGRRVAPLN